MPAIQNVERRGAVYYWRRTVRFEDGKPFTLRLSLRTTIQSVARSMGCAMTAKSETLKMTLGQAARSASLTTQQKAGIYRRAMEEMRDHLDQSHVAFQRTESNATYMIEGLVEIYETMLRDFVVHGVPENAGTREHVEARFPTLSDEQKETLLDFFGNRPDWRQRSRVQASAELAAAGVADTDDNVDMARKVNFEGRLAAALEYRRRLTDPASMWSSLAVDHAPIVSTSPASIVRQQEASIAVEPEVAEPWASMTPTEAAARFIADNPKIVGDARRKARWSDKTRSQFVSAARLLEKSYGARPIRLLAREDVVRLNDHFSRLPVSHHKSRQHYGMTLEEICREAAAEVQVGKRDAKTIGLQATSTNRHFLFLKELVGWVAKQVPGVAVIDWSDFVYEDDRNAREQRDAYTEEEGRALFRLPIWTGSRSLSRRLDPGSDIWHDAGFWVLPIAWYTGCRREEICQLTLTDIGLEDGIWFFTITDENGGRVKNRASIRLVPFAEELVRLGLPDYVKALRAAGETMLFPELQTASGKRGYGDVFYKNWWTKIARKLDFIEPGQAIHSFRHTVTTELKHREVFLETRADLVGHAMSGETAGRYSKAARLSRLKEAVDQIPTVTDRLRSSSTRLLPTSRRAPRPARPERQ
ncbi:MAG: integrase [Sphingomonas taxi]|uniref:Integrase n=1 Tax=Sphingomonas taxi TaxID=1549858 RepID=A0A2W5R596_9SPHN|nr:MAG: integrase [Sphingomonas taxi]